MAVEIKLAYEYKADIGALFQEYTDMLVDTLPFLKSAIGLYQRLGFCETKRYNDSPLDTTIFMKLTL